jgi:hypothetical protein
MSRQSVEMLIDELLANDELRVQFARNRFETLAELQLLGLDLTTDEVDAFAQTDLRTWFSSEQRLDGRVH